MSIDSKERNHQRELHLNSLSWEEAMEDIEVEEEEDMVEEEEAQSPVTIVASKDIWPEISNYLPSIL